MITHRLCGVTEMPQDLVTTTVTVAAPLEVIAELRWLAATAEHGPLGARTGHLWLTSGELQRCGNQLDSAAGREQR
jgi:hypothetical protein